MVCNNCGAQNADGVRFCANCGADLAQQAPANNMYGQPQMMNPNPAPVPVPGKGLAIASLVLGIISLLCFPIVTGVLGIALGGAAKSKGYRGGMATAGIVCGIIGLAAWVVMLIAGFSLPFGF